MRPQNTNKAAVVALPEQTERWGFQRIGPPVGRILINQIMIPGRRRSYQVARSI